MSGIVIVFCCIWICATIGAIFTKQTKTSYEAAFWATVVIGVGYLLFKGHS